MQDLLNKSNTSGLSGQLLLAMPTMQDERFSKSVIYVCAHSEEGAMGLIINRHAKSMNFSDILEQVFPTIDNEPISLSENAKNIPFIHLGGPVETERGFVLHSPDYHSKSHTYPVNDKISLTATIDILKAIAEGNGPSQVLLALGYAGWAPGQLEEELSDNGWLHCKANSDLIFETDAASKYETAFNSLGINPTHLVNQTGHA